LEESSFENHGSEITPSGLYLDGKSYFTIPIDIQSLYYPKLTIGMWVKIDSIRPSDATLFPQTLFSHSTSNLRRSVSLDTLGENSSTIGWIMPYGKEEGEGYLGPISYASSTEWIFVSGVISSNKIRLHVNQQEVEMTSGEVSGREDERSGNLEIGRGVKGYIRDLVIYSTDLREDELNFLAGDGIGKNLSASDYLTPTPIRSGYSFKLDQNKGIMVENHPSLAISPSMAMDLWVKMTQKDIQISENGLLQLIHKEDEYQMSISSNPKEDGNYTLILHIHLGKEDMGWETSIQIGDLSSLVSGKNADWFHLLFGWSFETLDLYVNGILSESMDLEMSLIFNNDGISASDLIIGGISSQFPLDVEIDEFHLWNNTEIIQLVSTSSSPSQIIKELNGHQLSSYDTMLHLPFDDGMGLLVGDKGINDLVARVYPSYVFPDDQSPWTYSSLQLNDISYGIEDIPLLIQLSSFDTVENAEEDYSFLMTSLPAKGKVYLLEETDNQDANSSYQLGDMIQSQFVHFQTSSIVYIPDQGISGEEIDQLSYLFTHNDNSEATLSQTIQINLNGTTDAPTIDIYSPLIEFNSLGVVDRDAWKDGNLVKFMIDVENEGASRETSLLFNHMETSELNDVYFEANDMNSIKFSGNIDNVNEMLQSIQLDTSSSESMDNFQLTVDYQGIDFHDESLTNTFQMDIGMEISSIPLIETISPTIIPLSFEDYIVIDLIGENFGEDVHWCSYQVEEQSDDDSFSLQTFSVESTIVTTSHIQCIFESTTLQLLSSVWKDNMILVSLMTSNGYKSNSLQLVPVDTPNILSLSPSFIWDDETIFDDANQIQLLISLDQELNQMVDYSCFLSTDGSETLFSSSSIIQLEDQRTIACLFDANIVEKLSKNNTLSFGISSFLEKMNEISITKELSPSFKGIEPSSIFQPLAGSPVSFSLFGEDLDSLNEFNFYCSIGDLILQGIVLNSQLIQCDLGEFSESVAPLLGEYSLKIQSNDGNFTNLSTDQYVVVMENPIIQQISTTVIHSSNEETVLDIDGINFISPSKGDIEIDCSFSGGECSNIEWISQFKLRATILPTIKGSHNITVVWKNENENVSSTFIIEVIDLMIESISTSVLTQEFIHDSDSSLSVVMKYSQNELTMANYGGLMLTWLGGSKDDSLSSSCNQISNILLICSIPQDLSEGSYSLTLKKDQSKGENDISISILSNIVISSSSSMIGSVKGNTSFSITLSSESKSDIDLLLHQSFMSILCNGRIAPLTKMEGNNDYSLECNQIPYLMKTWLEGLLILK